ncbi:acyltransferase [Pseudidiomarina aestuarii]|uniref:acyltransferase n=1 Tax=Pseudidiomarina aestuarii TaxID=624146 RepID=UPI003A97E370
MVKTLAKALIFQFYRFFLARKGVIIHHHAVISNVDFLGKAVIEPFCRLCGSPKISIGDNFYMNVGCHILGDIAIGNDVQIGPKTVIWGRDHGMKIGQLIREQSHVCAPVTIRDDVWVGANVTILKGVEIGKGAVIGAGAVVTQNIPEYAIAVGNPARVVKYREQ